MSYHFHLDFVSRGKGQSLVAKVAYEARAKLREERTGEYKDYTYKPDRPVQTFIDKKHGAELENVETLANFMDRADNEANSQTAITMTGALPKDLTPEGRARAVRDFMRENFWRKGIPAIGQIHPPHEHAPAPARDDGNKITDELDAEELHNDNWHVHITAALRPLGPDRQWGEKYITWHNYGDFLEHKRESWANINARYLENEGHQIEAERWRYGHLKQEQQHEKALERGDHEWAEKKAQEAGQHRGPKVDAMERREAMETDLGNASREIQQRNEDRAQLRTLKRGLAKLERADAFDKLKEELTKAEEVLAQTQQADRDAEKTPPQGLTRMYRGIGKNVAPAREGGRAFFSTDPARAATFGKLHYVDVRPDEMAKFERPHSQRILEAEPIAANDWRTADPAIIARVKPLEEENTRTHAPQPERDYEQRDPVREQIAWEDKVAEAAIEKEKKEQQFVEKPRADRTGAEEKHEPARPRFGDVLITRAAATAMSDPQQQHGETLSSPAAFRDALEKNRLALACVTPDEAAKSYRESKFAKAVERTAPVYQAGEIVMVREPRNDGSTAGRVHKLDQTKAADYLRCLTLDKSQLQGIEATKGTLDDRAQNRQRAIDAAKLRKARTQSRSPQRGGLAAHQIWAMQRVRNADEQRRERDRRDYSEKQKRDGGEIDTERYRTDPEYRRHAQNAQAYKSPDEKKRDRENEVRAIMEQQDRGGRG